MPGNAQTRRLRAAEHARQKREDTNRNTFCFLRLPNELKNVIYDLLLPHDCIITPGFRTEHSYQLEGEDGLCIFKRKARNVAWSTLVNITQVTRLIRSEALRYYYGSNAFTLPVSDLRLDQTASWIRSLPPDAFNVMRYVILVDYPICATPQRRRRDRSCTRIVWVDLFELKTRLLRAYAEMWADKRTTCDACGRKLAKEIKDRTQGSAFKKLVTTQLTEAPSADRMLAMVDALIGERSSRSIMC